MSLSEERYGQLRERLMQRLGLLKTPEEAEEDTNYSEDAQDEDAHDPETCPICNSMAERDDPEVEDPIVDVYAVGRDYLYTGDMALPTSGEVFIDLHYPNENPDFPGGLRIVLDFDQEVVSIGFKRNTDKPDAIVVYRGEQ